MSDFPAMNSSRGSSRPVSWISVVAVFGGFALFLVLVYFVYLPRRDAGPLNVPPENASADQAWKATPAGRKAYLNELREKQQKQLTTYAWVDQAKGVVRLPIERAMELTVQEINAPKPTRPDSSSGPR